MQYNVSFVEWAPREVGKRDAIFEIIVGGQYYRVVRVVLPRMAEILVGRRLELEDGAGFDAPEFQRGVLRYAVRTIEDALMAGAIPEAVLHELHIIEIQADDETHALIAQLGRGDKNCSYEVSEGRDLFCTAAAPNDETALPFVLDNGRRTAPTSRPLCAACGLPDTDYICSHFLHPQVIGIRTMGGPSGFTSRDVFDGLCDLNRPEFAQHRECHAGGNPCWERLVEVETAPTVGQAPPQAIEQALDDLDVRWRLAFHKPLVRLPGAEEVSMLALACSSRDEFERRLSSLADIIKLLNIPDELLPAADKLPEKSLTLVRLELLFNARLADEDRTEVMQAIGTLRGINRLRVGGQHSGAQADRAQAADRLGVALDGRWGEAWDRVRALAAQALRDVGTAARRVADTE